MTGLIRSCKEAEDARVAALELHGGYIENEGPLLKRPTVGPKYSLPLLNWRLDEPQKGEWVDVAYRIGERADRM